MGKEDRYGGTSPFARKTTSAAPPAAPSHPTACSPPPPLLPPVTGQSRPTGSPWPGRRGMRRDAAVASQLIAVGATETGRAEAVVIEVDAEAAAHGVECRICHLCPEGGDGPAAVPGSEVIRLGYGCKELGRTANAPRHGFGSTAIDFREHGGLRLQRMRL